MPGQSRGLQGSGATLTGPLKKTRHQKLLLTYPAGGNLRQTSSRQIRTSRICNACIFSKFSVTPQTPECFSQLVLPNKQQNLTSNVRASTMKDYYVTPFLVWRKSS